MADIKDSFSSFDKTPEAASALLRHFEPAVMDAFIRLREHRSPEDADIVIGAIVLDHIPKPNDGQFDLSDENLKLMEDLGFDSIAIAETAFFIEDLFQISIGTDEILKIDSMGDLRRLIRHKLGTTQPSKQ